MLIFVLGVYGHVLGWQIAVLIPYALYGGAAGILIQRFSIPQALAIPVIPTLLLLIFAGALLPLGLLVMSFVPAVMCAWLAFWLHSGWARKQRLREAELIP
jgi:hypothetical protein